MTLASSPQPTPHGRQRLSAAWLGTRTAAAMMVALSAATAGCADLSSPGTTDAPVPGQSVQASAMKASVPLRVEIPDAKISSRIISLGLNKDRTVAVPPIQKNDPVGWYKNSPTPGETGPSVLLGHVTVGRYGKGVFSRLEAVDKGDSILVTRKDKSTARFTVDRVKKYPRNKFPTDQVYANTATPQLRVITCAGSLNSRTGQYKENLIVFASLASG
ncbi:class F sortase [Streptomyces sp. NBC_01614]|uniref:Class F sortase n=1 Tax=Streptomyces sp. NBC_00180 TaxID=2903632 RepID=A0AAU1IA98_9ACTN